MTTEDGTGVVHMAPAYGEADAAACQAAGIPIVLTVDEQGKYLPMVTRLGGRARLRGEQADHHQAQGRRRPRPAAPTTRTPTRTAGGAATR